MKGFLELVVLALILTGASLPMYGQEGRRPGRGEEGMRPPPPPGDEEGGEEFDEPPMPPDGPREGREGRRPGREGERPEPRDGETMEPLSEEKIDEVKGFLKDNFPEKLDELARLEKENKNGYLRRLREAAMEMRRLKQLQKERPDEYDRVLKERKLDLAVRQIVEKIRSTKTGKEGTQATGEAEALQKKLFNVLSELFDIREAQKAREVEQIEQRVKELRSKLEKRKAGREEIIKRHLKDLIGEEREDDLEW